MPSDTHVLDPAIAWVECQLEFERKHIPYANSEQRRKAEQLVASLRGALDVLRRERDRVVPTTIDELQQSVAGLDERVTVHWSPGGSLRVAVGPRLEWSSVEVNWSDYFGLKAAIAAAYAAVCALVDGREG